MTWKSPAKQILLKAILGLQTADEAQRFLRDLMTPNEIEEFSKRLQAADFLNRKVPYTTIEAQTGFSSTTVARVAKWLNNGRGGYRRVLAQLHHQPLPQHPRGV